MEEQSRYTHTHTHTLTQIGLSTNLCLDPAFLSGSICPSVQRKGERSLGGACPVTVRSLPGGQRHWGKPKGKKNRCTEGRPCQNIVMESLWIYLEHLALHTTTKPNKPLGQPV